MDKKLVEVVAAAIENENNEILSEEYLSGGFLLVAFYRMQRLPDALSGRRYRGRRILGNGRRRTECGGFLLSFHAGG